MPKVTLGGTQFEVPPLVPRQQRHVIPALLRAVPAMVAWQAEVKAGKIFEAEYPLAAYDDMLTVAYWGAVWPSNKSSDRDIILDMQISHAELTTACLAVQMQTGLFAKAEPGAPEPEKKTAAQA